MKAILVINMPRDCLACPFLDDICFPKRKFEKGFPFDERPKECPLKPLPQKMSWGHTSEYIDGYNACLDAITGETE